MLVSAASAIAAYVPRKARAAPAGASIMPAQGGNER
jgi:hypothetical protein